MLLAGANMTGATMCAYIRIGLFVRRYLTDLKTGPYRLMFQYPTETGEPIEWELFLPVAGQDRFPYGANVQPFVIP